MKLSALAIVAFLGVGCVSQNAIRIPCTMNEVTPVFRKIGSEDEFTIIRQWGDAMFYLNSEETVTYIHDFPPYGVLNLDKDRLSIEHDGKIVELGHAGEEKVLVIEDGVFATEEMKEYEPALRKEYKRVLKQTNRALKDCGC